MRSLARRVAGACGPDDVARTTRRWDWDAESTRALSMDDAWRHTEDGQTRMDAGDARCGRWDATLASARG